MYLDYQNITQKKKATTESDIDSDLDIDITPAVFQKVTRTEKAVWTEGGKWQDTINSVWGLLHEVHFKNSNMQSPVKTIFLSEFANGDFEITLQIRPDDFISFARQLVSLGVPKPDNLSRVTKLISVREHQTNNALLSSFLKKAYECEPDVGSIFPEINRLINRQAHTVKTKTVATQTEPQYTSNEPIINKLAKLGLFKGYHEHVRVGDELGLTGKMAIDLPKDISVETLTHEIDQLKLMGIECEAWADRSVTPQIGVYCTEEQLYKKLCIRS